MQGLDASDSHSALTDATLTASILRIIKKDNQAPGYVLRTASRSDTRNKFLKRSKLLTLNELF